MSSFLWTLGSLVTAWVVGSLAMLFNNLLTRYRNEH